MICDRPSAGLCTRQATCEPCGTCWRNHTDNRYNVRLPWMRARLSIWRSVRRSNSCWPVRGVRVARSVDQLGMAIGRTSAVPGPSPPALTGSAQRWKQHPADAYTERFCPSAHTFSTSLQSVWFLSRTPGHTVAVLHYPAGCPLLLGGRLASRLQH